MSRLELYSQESQLDTLLMKILSCLRFELDGIFNISISEFIQSFRALENSADPLGY